MLRGGLRNLDNTPQHGVDDSCDPFFRGLHVFVRIYQ